MSLSTADFKIAYPEFDSIADATVSAKLALALLSIDATAYGDSADDGQGRLTAHLLAMSPFGTNAGLRVGKESKGTSVYWSGYEDLRRRVGTAFRLVLP